MRQEKPVFESVSVGDTVYVKLGVEAGIGWVRQNLGDFFVPAQVVKATKARFKALVPRYDQEPIEVDFRMKDGFEHAQKTRFYCKPLGGDDNVTDQHQEWLDCNKLAKSIEQVSYVLSGNLDFGEMTQEMCDEFLAAFNKLPMKEKR